MRIEHCPFCGWDDKLSVMEVECRTEPVEVFFRVICDTCHAAGPTAKTREEAVLKWNEASEHY